ncbi:MAG: hypothetical protein IT564_10845 [Rhodospirillales bacterium]|nr:hypothetical protein [Rhodospirillales bacterium]
MIRRTITISVLVAAAWFSPSPRADDPVHAFDVAVADGKVARSQRTLKVPHRAEVSITWSVDRPLVIHLEGYDVVVIARPGQPETMRFKAFATGRFPVHAHEEDQGEAKKHAHGRGALLRLEVHPQ